MESQKIYLAGDQSNGLNSALVAALQNRGVDPSVLACLNGNNGLFGNGNDILALIILFAVFGWGGNGFGGFGGRGNACGTTEREMIMSAIQRNGTDIASLASAANCSVGQIQSAISALATQICNLSAQSGQNSLQIINAIQSGDNAIVSQLCNCCCDLKQLIAEYGAENRLATCQQTNTLQGAINSVAVGQERGFSNLAFEAQKQTCELSKAIADNTAQVLAGQRAAEMREMQRELAERDRKIAEQAVFINNAQQTSIFGQMINGAVAPLIAGQRDFSDRLAKIECKQPDTITVNRSNGVYLDGCCAAQLGLGPLAGLGLYGSPIGAGTGFFG